MPCPAFIYHPIHTYPQHFCFPSPYMGEGLGVRVGPTPSHDNAYEVIHATCALRALRNIHYTMS